jgi:hypothetical protein
LIEEKLTKLAKKRKPRPSKKGGKKLNPNRFKKQDGLGLFSFDPIRRDVFKWGLIAGGTGGLFMLRSNQIIWPIIGVATVVFMTNYHINKASQRIPRLHATVMSFIGVMIAMFGVIIVGTIILAYLEAGGETG